ncbi:MAG: ATP synthase F1 subunit gamma [Nitrospirota bacterium]
MPSLQATRRRIGSVKNTQKITKAMKLVSASKLRRAQERILAARPYSDQMTALLAQLSRRVNANAHPLLQPSDGNKVELVVISSDRGLCGSFNAQLFRQTIELARRLEADGKKISLTTIGRKARDFFRRRPWPITKSWVQLPLQFEQARTIAQELIDAFLSGQRHEVRLLFTEFRSVVSQRPASRVLLPIGQTTEPAPATTETGSYTYEPEEEELLTELLPRSVAVQLFRALLESAASEQGARMMAMDSAARNAGQMIGRLTLIYNKTRQAAITKELMDIVGGAEALR